MASNKSLAAEIEAALNKHLWVRSSPAGSVAQIHGIAEAVAELAASHSRTSDGAARSMRERAAEAAKHRYSPLNTERFIVNGETVRNRHGHELFATIEEIERHVSERVAVILALPLQPEGERNA